MEYEWSNKVATNGTYHFHSQILCTNDENDWKNYTTYLLPAVFQFQNATSFDSDLPWDVSQVTTMSSTFDTATIFNGDISTWDTSACVDMSAMFTAASNFAGDLSLWNTERVVRTNGMFEVTQSFNSNIGSWNVSNVVSMSRMFRETRSFNQDISGWDVGQTTAMDSMFQVRIFSLSVPQILATNENDNGPVLYFLLFYIGRHGIFPKLMCLG